MTMLFPSTFAQSPGGWVPFTNFNPALSGATQFAPIARSGASMLAGQVAPSAAAPSIFPSLAPEASGAALLGGFGGGVGGGVGGATAGAPSFSGLGGMVGRTATAGAGEGVVGGAVPSAVAAAESAAPAAAATGAKGLLTGLLSKPGVKGGLYGLGAQMLANQFLAPGLRNMVDQGGTQANVGQFGLGAIKSLPIAVGAGMAIGGPLGALAGVGIAGAAGVADAVFNFDKAQPKAKDALDTFTAAVQLDPSWTLQDKSNVTTQIALAKATGATDSQIISSIIQPTVMQHQAQVQQYQQNQAQVQAQAAGLAAQSHQLGVDAQPILSLLANGAEQGYDLRTAALNAPNVDPTYAAITRDLAAQSRDTNKLMAASLYQQALAAPYVNYQKALDAQNQQLQQLGSQIQNGYISQVAQQFLGNQSSSNQSTIQQILSGVTQ